MAYIPPNPNGQATMANSAPVVIASNQSAVPISGTVAFSNSTIAVTGTFFQATQPVSIAGTVAVSGPLTDTQLRANPVPVSLTSTTVTGSVAVTGTFWQATQPISATSLPLPTGAAADATLTGGTQRTKITDGSNNVTVGSATAASSETSVSRLAVSSSLRLLDTTQASGSQLVTAKGDQTLGLWVNVMNTSAIPVSISGSVPVTGTFWQATQPVSIASMPTTPVTGTFWQATQPVSIASTVAVSGPLTDTQLRASAVPVSGTFFQATQPVSMAAAPTGAALDATLTGGTQTTKLTDGTNTVGIAGSTAVSSETALERLKVNASLRLLDNSLTAGARLVAALGDQTTGMWVNVKNTSIPVTLTSTTVTGTVAVTQATLTKGTQGATGVTTQDLKDGGRAIVNAATAIAGVTSVTTEALLSLNVSRDGAATAAVTTIAVTSGKRYRITGMIASARSTSAAVLSARVALRMNPSGAVTATSPILAIASMTQQAAALAEAGDTCVIMFPDGIEVSGTMQVGLSQVCSATTGVVYASLIGYEY